MSAIGTVFALAFALVLIPDCCLNGRHEHGPGMTTYGPICSALR